VRWRIQNSASNVDVEIHSIDAAVEGGPWSIE